MKNKKTELSEKDITGFYVSGVEFRGELYFEGSFRIDGYFKGTIDSDSVLIVGKNGKVEGEIRVGSLINYGEIKGTIEAKEKVEVNAGGRVTGTINSPNLVIEEGAYLEADCQTLETVNKPSRESKRGEG
ncbi:MAG: polymer-forming cytoskeletal protein [Candidatus Aminicenantales bacterium]